MSPREIDDVKKKFFLRKFVKNGLDNIPNPPPPPVQSTLQKPGINRVKNCPMIILISLAEF